MYVLFWKGGHSLQDRLIRCFSRGPYSHCELLFSDGTRFGVSSAYEARYLLDPQGWNPNDWDCIGVRGGDEAKVRAFCDTQVGAEYDWLGVAFAIVLPWGRQTADKWFCSELTIAGLQEGDYWDVRGIKAHQYTPVRLANKLLEAGERLVSLREFLYARDGHTLQEVR